MCPSNGTIGISDNFATDLPDAILHRPTLMRRSTSNRLDSGDAVLSCLTKGKVFPISYIDNKSTNFYLCQYAIMTIVATVNKHSNMTAYSM